MRLCGQLAAFCSWQWAWCVPLLALLQVTWAVVKGVLFVVAWPILCVLQLAAFLLRSVFRTLVWTVCTVLKAPLYLVLAIYYGVACVV
jgi:hypothetical protein